MLVVAVPNVVVLEPVDVRLELTTVVEVHVGNEELYGEPSMALPLEMTRRLYFIWDLRSPPAHRTNCSIF